MAFGYGWTLPFSIIMCVIVRFLAAAFAAPYSSYVLMKFKHHLNTGSSVLISNALAALGAGLAPFITGAVMDAAGWKWYYIVLGIFVIVALVMGIAGEIYIRKNKKLSEYI